MVPSTILVKTGSMKCFYNPMVAGLESYLLQKFSSVQLLLYNMQVTIISRVRHAAQKGHTVLLLQTDDIQENFYDVFNRRFRCVYIKDENRYYANISCGTHSKLSRIHPNFKCMIVLKESEVKNTPSPFLNRFEKFHLSYDVLVAIALDLLPPTLQSIMAAVRSKVSDNVKLRTIIRRLVFPCITLSGTF